MPLWKRDISIEVDEDVANMLSMKAQLKDNIHDMELRLKISLPDYTIRQAELEMREVPQPCCHEIEPAVKDLEGLKIGPGFSRRVREILGGRRGCINLLHLVMETAPLAINVSWWAYKARGTVTEEEFEQGRSLAMSGQCVGYP